MLSGWESRGGGMNQRLGGPVVLLRLCLMTSSCAGNETISGGFGRTLHVMDQPGFWLRLIAFAVGLAIMRWLSSLLFPIRGPEPPPDMVLKADDAVDARISELRAQRRPEQERAREQEGRSQALRQEFRRLLTDAFKQATRYPVHISDDYDIQVATKTKQGQSQTWATNIGADDASDRFYMYGLFHSLGYIGDSKRLDLHHRDVSTATRYGREVYVGPRSALADIVGAVTKPILGTV